MAAWRDGAKIVVAFFTDAEDCSDPSQRMSMRPLSRQRSARHAASATSPAAFELSSSASMIETLSSEYFLFS